MLMRSRRQTSHTSQTCFFLTRPFSRILTVESQSPHSAGVSESENVTCTISCEKTSTLQQGSLYYQPKQCTVTIRSEIPQNDHRFALFDPPKCQNGSHFMTPLQTSNSTIHLKVLPTLPLCHNNARIKCEIFTTEKPNMERRRPPKEQLLLQIRNAISGNSASSAWIS